MKIRTRLAATLTTVGLALTAVVAAGPAEAASPARPVYTTTYSVVDKSYVSNHVDFTHLLARCYAAGGTCTITKGKQATTTIDVSLGWSRAGVAAGLGISAASTVTLSIGCSSPVLAPGRTWTAYAVGRYYSYKIQKRVSAPSGVTITKSGLLHAFSAYSNQIYCR